MNEKLKELISIPPEDVCSADDELLIEELKNSQLIMPIEITSDNEDFSFKPLKISNEDENIFIPLFSDEEELVKSSIEFNVINISAKNLAEMIIDNKEYFGIAINPFSEFSLAIPLNEFLELF